MYISIANDDIKKSTQSNSLRYVDTTVGSVNAITHEKVVFWERDVITMTYPVRDVTSMTYPVRDVE